MKGVGFRTVDGWPGCYTHHRNGLCIMAHIDDFKLVGPTSAVKIMWTRMTDVVSTEPPSPMDISRLHREASNLRSAASWRPEKIARNSEVFEAERRAEGKGDGVRRHAVPWPVL